MKTTTIYGRGICTGCHHYIALNMDGVVRRHRAADDAWCSGSRQEPAPVVEHDPRRAQWIADARALLNQLEPEADPTVEAYVDVADAERYAQRDDYVNSDEPDDKDEKDEASKGGATL